MAAPRPSGTSLAGPSSGASGMGSPSSFGQNTNPTAASSKFPAFLNRSTPAIPNKSSTASSSPPISSPLSNSAPGPMLISSPIKRATFGSVAPASGAVPAPVASGPKASNLPSRPIATSVGAAKISTNQIAPPTPPNKPGGLPGSAPSSPKKSPILSSNSNAHSPPLAPALAPNPVAAQPKTSSLLPTGRQTLSDSSIATAQSSPVVLNRVSALSVGTTTTTTSSDGPVSPRVAFGARAAAATVAAPPAAQQPKFASPAAPGALKRMITPPAAPIAAKPVNSVSSPNLLVCNSTAATSQTPVTPPSPRVGLGARAASVAATTTNVIASPAKAGGGGGFARPTSMAPRPVGALTQSTSSPQLVLSSKLPAESSSAQSGISDAVAAPLKASSDSVALAAFSSSPTLGTMTVSLATSSDAIPTIKSTDLQHSNPSNQTESPATSSPAMARAAALLRSSGELRTGPLRPRSGAKITSRPPLPKNTFRLHRNTSRPGAESERPPRSLYELEMEDNEEEESPLVSTFAEESYNPWDTSARLKEDEKAPSMEFLDDSDEENEQERRNDDSAYSSSSGGAERRDSSGPEPLLDEPLDEWIEAYSEDGYIYFHNLKSGRSTWDPPVGYKPPPSGLGTPVRSESVAAPVVPRIASVLVCKNISGSLGESAEDSDDDSQYGPDVFPDIEKSYHKVILKKNAIVARHIEPIKEDTGPDSSLVIPTLEDQDQNQDDNGSSYYSELESTTGSEMDSSIGSQMTSSVGSEMSSSMGSHMASSYDGKLYLVEEIVDVSSGLHQPLPLHDIRVPTSQPRTFIPLDAYLAQQATGSAAASTSAQPPRSEQATDPHLDKLKRLELEFVGFPGSLIKQGRKFIREGELIKSPKRVTGRWKASQVFVFNDLIVIASRKAQHRFKVKLAVPLDECIVKIPGRRGAASFDVTTPVEKVCFIAKNAEEAYDWYRCVTEAPSFI